ncbi:MAG: tetratricopeptide repeat protein, partial [Natronosporangium sp.]
MPLAVKPTIQRVVRRLPVYRMLPDGALRTYAALRYHGQHSSQEEITRYVRSIDGIPTRWLSAAMVAARAAFLTGQDDLLQETLDTLARRFPESPQLYLLLADLQTYHGQVRPALDSAHRSRLLKPSYPRATARVVALSHRLLGPAEADQVAVAAIRRFPRTSEVLWAVAHTCATPAQFQRLRAGWQDRAAEPGDLLRAVRQ